MRQGVVSATIFVSLLLCGTGYTQTTSGSIAGNVVDAQHAALPNAAVTAKELQQQFTVNTKTDESGRFVFPQVPPGTYTIAVEAPGFKRMERAGVVLNANDKLAIGEITMEVGAVTEQIEVSASAITLQTESAERSAALVSKQMENIAVNSRSYLDLVKLVPGVVSTVNLQTAGPGGLSSISVNGTRVNSNQLTINGISNVDTGSNGSVNVTLSLDSVQEFKILTGVYQAEYGRAMGAQISVVTKSGTSDLHGSAYWFHRHDGLNANNWFNNRNGLPRNLFRFNDLGFTVGGPVYIPKILQSRQKLFFFWSEEFQRQLRPQGFRQLTVPTAAERGGDFSKSVDNNGNPFTIRDYTTGAPFPGNVIPANRLYAPGIALLKMLPSPNVSNSCALNPGAGGCIKGYDYQSQISDQYPRREDLIRIDYNLNSKMRLFGHWINNNNTYSSYYGSFVLGSNTPLSPIQYANPGYGWAIGTTYVIGPTLTNEFNFGVTNNSILIDETGNQYTRATSGVNLPLLYPNAVQRDYVANPSFGGSRLANGPTFGTSDAPFINYNTTFDITDGVAKIWDRHAFKFGMYMQRSRKNQTSFGAFDGSYNFGDNSSNPYDTGYGYANAALGVYNSFSQAANFINGQYRYWNIEFYAQDTWKVTPRLTLDYGIRGAYYQPQYDQSLQASTFVLSQWNPAQAPRLYVPQIVNGTRSAVDPVTGQVLPAADIGFIVPGSGNIQNGIAQGGVNGFTKYLQDTRAPQWGPRLGIAWDPMGTQKMVIRTGVGFYYDRYQGNRVFDFVRNPPLGIQPTLNYGLASTISPTSSLLSPPSFYAADQPGKLPTVYNFTFGVQTRLPFSMLLDTAYVGALSRHLQDNRNLNYVPFGAAFLPQNQDPTISSSLLGSAALPAQFLRNMRGIGDINLYEGAATGNYNALQLTLNRRVGHLFLGMAYTWSKDLTTASGDTNFVRPDQYTRMAYYGPSGNDRRQNFALNYVYDLPTLKGKNAVAKAVLGGWQISGVTRFMSGSPYGIGYSITGVGSQNITGSTTEGARVFLLGNPMTGSNNPYNRLNAALVAPPVVGSIGLESGVNYLTGPGINNWDISVQKEFVVKERLRMQFRADAFNAFNHTQFSGVNATVTYPALNNNNPTNLVYKADGSLNNINGFGSVNGARDPRLMQLMLRFQF
ncbi:MAG TPA: carboxypeptidase regulatory-like domain-containing protein [Candidatus Acidoferrales bacterium]|nr:carboxypeptidase regulatory-like domain-containing protein [Candidatus Acidoferrales bacterium]